METVNKEKSITMKNLGFDYSGVLDFLDENEIKAAADKAYAARKILTEATGEGSEFTGWVDLPISYDREEFERIKRAAKKIRSDSEALIVIGIGGSYLGARAAIEFLTDSFYNISGEGPKVFFAGNSISPKYLKDLIRAVGDKDFSVNVISKSGTTTEPAIAFRVFRELLIKKYGEQGAAERIYATTDKAKGALKELSARKGYETFVVPDEIGGRYSVLTAVGLLPIAAAGCDIDLLMKGAADMRELCLNNEFKNNPALKYAAVRNLLYAKGKKVEITSNYEPSMHYIGEWWKQLFGESEGKKHRGIFPAAVDLTTDLHSMGQYIQDGERILMETVIELREQGDGPVIREEAEDTDKLNYLAGRDMAYVNQMALNGTMLAHEEGGVPCMKISIADQSEHSLGELFYFYEFACGVSGYMLGVNPFDQPGVESYKKNMFALLGKPGYENEREKLLRKLK